MTEMTLTGKDHNQAQFICGFNRFRIPNGTTGLDDGADTGFSRFFHCIGHGKEGV